MEAKKIAATKAGTNAEEAPLDDLVRKPKLEKTWLIQRLLVPYKHLPVGNPFAFGGGYKNGGLSNEANETINKIFSFDYMGAAEYEWGAVPNSLGKLWDAGQKGELALGIVKLEEGRVFFICRQEITSEVEKIIRKAAGGGMRTRDLVGLRDSLQRRTRKQGDKAGWLELGNHFMFFTDKRMFEGAARMFGLGSGDRDDAPSERAQNHQKAEIIEELERK